MRASYIPKELNTFGLRIMLFTKFCSFSIEMTKIPLCELTHVNVKFA